MFRQFYVPHFFLTELQKALIIRGEREQSVEIVVSDAYRKAIEKERKAKLASDVAERLEKCTQPIRRIAR